MIKASVHTVLPSHTGYTLLLRAERSDRVLPMVIGEQEAQAILVSLNRIPVPRPLTADLFYNTLQCLGHRVARIEIHSMVKEAFVADIVVVTTDGSEARFDSRPSDAVAIAMRFRAPVMIEPSLFDEHAKPLAELEGFGGVGGNVFPGTNLPNIANSPDVSSAALPHIDPPTEAIEPEDAELDQLNEKMQQAIDIEDYEKAATLRDKIQALKFGEAENE